MARATKTTRKATTVTTHPLVRLSERLAQRLSAHRTAALQIEVARHPHVALAAVVHGMVQTVLQGRYRSGDLPLGVSLTVQDQLESLTLEEPESSAAVALPPYRKLSATPYRRIAQSSYEYTDYLQVV